VGDVDYRQSGSAGTVIAIVAAIVLLLFGSLVVVGVGAWFFMRTEVQKNEMHAVMQAERAQAMAERARAEAMASQAVAEAIRQSVPSSASTLEMLVELDQEGKILVDGRSVDWDTLKTILQQAAGDPNTVVTVRLRVDPRCPFGNVAEVQSLCGEAGVSEVSFAIAEE
jgi:biopolymer transport protein ExbD